MNIRKEKLVEQLKKRRQSIVKHHTETLKQYEKQVATYREKAKASVKEATAKLASLPLNASPREIRASVDAVVSFFDRRRMPAEPPKRPKTAAVDKALLQLEICEDQLLSLESSKNYLSILEGEFDQSSQEFHDEDDYDDEDED